MSIQCRVYFIDRIQLTISDYILSNDVDNFTLILQIFLDSDKYLNKHC
jgi:hypothetical protein